jgi:transposase
MSIKSQVSERSSIMSELKTLNTRAKSLRQRCKLLDSQIDDYLRETGQPGIKYKGNVIRVEEKEVRKMKKKSDRESSSLEILKSMGINDPEGVLKALNDVQREEPSKKTFLRFNSIKK